MAALDRALALCIGAALWSTAMLTGYTGKGNALADALTSFAETCADQAEHDYDRLVAAASQGRISVAYED